MKQFAIENGDLVLGPGGYSMVRGGRKIRQDLGHALVEPVGTDRFHPRYGSALPAMIGDVANPEMRGLVESEVHRVVRNYIVSRMALIQQDVQSGRRPQFTSDEIVQSITAVDVRQSGDRYFVRVSIRTLSNELTIVTTLET